MKAFGVIAVIAVLAAIPLFMKMHYSNKEIGLRKQIEAQQEANKTSFDTCWKIIQQQAQVADQHKDAFKDVYVSIMEERHYEKGGTLFKFVTESNPSFDIRLFEKVANSIEEQRLVWKRDQQKLIDLKREHDTLLEIAPASWFVGGRPKVEITIVTSTKTEKSFETRKEDDTKVFQNP